MNSRARRPDETAPDKTDDEAELTALEQQVAELQASLADATNANNSLRGELLASENLARDRQAENARLAEASANLSKRLDAAVEAITARDRELAEARAGAASSEYAERIHSLENALELACSHFERVSGNLTGLGPELAQWAQARKQQANDRLDATKQRARAKLTPEERAALGLD